MLLDRRDVTIVLYEVGLPFLVPENFDGEEADDNMDDKLKTSPPEKR